MCCIVLLGNDSDDDDDEDSDDDDDDSNDNDDDDDDDSADDDSQTFSELIKSFSGKGEEPDERRRIFWGYDLVITCWFKDVNGWVAQILKKEHQKSVIHLCWLKSCILWLFQGHNWFTFLFNLINIFYGFYTPYLP